MRDYAPERGHRSQGAVRRWTSFGPAHSLYAAAEEMDAGSHVGRRIERAG
jgi:hypothetical protein